MYFVHLPIIIGVYRYIIKLVLGGGALPPRFILTLKVFCT